MCGIVGYVGQQQAAPFLLDGLHKLEYRGYDSAGIAVLDHSIRTRRAMGRLAGLQQLVQDNPLQGCVGIGHTRWATHGAPSEQNAHPHLSENGRFAIVHNGIIENYRELKAWLRERGYVFRSETDSEVLAHLFEHLYTGDLLTTMRCVLQRIRGFYAFAVLSADHPGQLVAARKDAPLIVGLGEGEQYLASDIPAFLSCTRRCKLLGEGEIVRLTADTVEIFDGDLQPVQREEFPISWDVEAAEKNGYETFMRKEIDEQPQALRKCLSAHVQNGVLLPSLKLSDSALRSVGNIHIVACGSAYHAGMVGKQVIEELARIPVDIDLASEFRYRRPILTRNDLCITISQSGETADTLAAIREARANNVPVLSIVNVVGSTIARESTDVLYTCAGPEIAVATTKGYSTQLLVLYLLALKLANLRKTISEERQHRLLAAIQRLPEQIGQLLQQEPLYQNCAELLAHRNSVFLIGRGIDYSASLEGSLKIKEISYIHSEAYAGGELKHGTISLIEDGTPVIALATQELLEEKVLSNVREVIARGAQVIVLCSEGNTLFDNESFTRIPLPPTDYLLTSSLSIIPLQLMAYHVAQLHGCDIDKPRNLAKSVTVE